MDKPRSPEVKAFWNAYRAARDVPEEDYVVCSFGSSPEIGDELLALVLDGPKRATAYLLRDVEIGGERMSIVGGHVVVLDGADRPRADWLAMHVSYFTAQAKAQGFSFDDSMLAVFERFTLVWPPEHADPQSAVQRSR